MEDEALGMEEGGRHHPPGFEDPVLRGGVDRGERQVLVDPVVGDQPLKDKDQGAEPNDEVGDHGLPGGHGAAVDGLDVRRRAF